MSPAVSRGPDRVVVSAAFLTHDRITGIERYSIELIGALRKTCPPSRDVIVAGPTWLRRYVGNDIESPPTRMPRPLVNEVWLPRLLSRVDASLLHTLAYGCPMAFRQPWVATVHDLVPWDRPETLGRAGRWYLGPTLRHTLRHRRNTQVISLAASTSAGLRSRTAPDAHIVTVPASAGRFFSPAEPAPEGPPWRLLSVGTVEPRKGLASLATAVAMLRTAGVAVTARVAGRHGWGPPLPPELVSLGYLTDDELLDEYHRAHLLIAPSEMEGFDLPVLEAMSCGLPVIATDIPVHRDHFSEAAILVPVSNAEALAGAIQTALLDPRQRAAARDSGLRMAQRFNWEAVATRIHTIYDAALTRPR